MIASRDFLKWAWPSYGLVFPIDFMLAVAIVGILSALAIGSYSPYQFRAKVSEVFAIVSVYKLDLVERLALSGDPLDLPTAEAGEPGSAVTIDDHLSGRGRGATQAKRADAAPAQPDRVNTRAALAARTKGGEAQQGGGVGKYVSSVRIAGSAILLSGTIDGRAFDLSIFPAAIEDAVPSVYIWMCGRSRVPEGMLAQPAVVRNSLPDHLLERECRRRKNK